MNVGDEVRVYDRYRLASPATCIIKKFSESNDGVQVEIINPKEGGHIHGHQKWPEFWVHQAQLRTPIHKMSIDQDKYIFTDDKIAGIKLVEDLLKDMRSKWLKSDLKDPAMAVDVILSGIKSKYFKKMVEDSCREFTEEDYG